MAKIKVENHNGVTYVSFKCPGCEDTHSVPVSNGRWTWNGSSDKPTLFPSLNTTCGHYVRGHKPQDPCWCKYDGESPYACYQCHIWVKDGKIQFLNDCTHKLKGQTVEMSEIPE